MSVRASSPASKAAVGNTNGVATPPNNTSRRASDGEEIVWPLPKDRVTASTTGSVHSGQQASSAVTPVIASDDDGTEDSEVVWRMTPRPDKTFSHAVTVSDSTEMIPSGMYTRKKQPPSLPFSGRGRDNTDERSIASGSSSVHNSTTILHAGNKEAVTSCSFTPSAAETKAAGMHMINTPSYSSMSPSKNEFRPRGNSVLLSDEEREAFAAARLPLETAEEQAERIRERVITSLDGLRLSKPPSQSASPPASSRVAPTLIVSPPTHSPPPEGPSATLLAPTTTTPHVTMVGSLSTGADGGGGAGSTSPTNSGLGDPSIVRSHERNTTNIFADSTGSPMDLNWSPTFNDLSQASPLPENYATSAERREAKRQRKEERAAKRAAKEARRAKRDAERNAAHATDGVAAAAPATLGAWNVQAQPLLVASDANTTPAFGDGTAHGTPALKLTLATPAAVAERGLTGSDRETQGATTGALPISATMRSHLDDVSFALADGASAGAGIFQSPASVASGSSPRVPPRSGLVMFQQTPDGPGAATRQASMQFADESRSGFGVPGVASKELHTRELDVAVGGAQLGASSSKSGRHGVAARGGRHATQPREALGKSQLKGYAPSNAKRRLKRRHHHHRKASEKGREEGSGRARAPKPVAQQQQPHAEAKRGAEKEKDNEGHHRRNSRRHSHRRRRGSAKPAAAAEAPAAAPPAPTPTASPKLDKNNTNNSAFGDDRDLQEPYASPRTPHPPPGSARDQAPAGGGKDSAKAAVLRSAPQPRRCTSAAGPAARTPVPPALPRVESHSTGDGERVGNGRRSSAIANLGATTASSPNIVSSGYSARSTAPLYGASPAESAIESTLKPTPPPAVAGSAVAAVHELKHQKVVAAAVAAGHAQDLTDARRGNDKDDDSDNDMPIQQVESFPSSYCRSRSRDRDDDRRPRVSGTNKGNNNNNARHGNGKASPQYAAAGGARSVESDYYSSYSHSQELGRGDRRSSCSSFDSYTSDARSESSYGYSSYTYSSSSSDSELLCEKIPPRPGSRTSPPLLLFTDLQHRHMMAQRMDLRRYAETGVIYEWNIRDGYWDRVETQVVVASEPFSHGNMRASYFMIDLQRLDCKLVAKRYLKSSVEDNQYFDDVSMHSISGHWARLFNAAKPPKEVRFVPAAVLELTERTPPLLLAMEPQLEGTFTKYNNNSGYVPKNARWTPQAFSHFTYHVSNHQLLIVDIQGVGDIFTDPQILSPDGEGYGRGNLGLKGIRRFLSTHKCNSVCEALNLPPIQHRRDVHGSESKTEKSDYVAPENLAREQLPPKVYKSTDVQRTRSMNNSQAGGPTILVSGVSKPGNAGVGVGAVSTPAVPMHDPRFMQHIRNTVSRPKTNYFAPAAGMLPMTPTPSGYAADSSSGKLKSGNSTGLAPPGDSGSHSMLANSANAGAPLTQPAQPHRPPAPPAVVPFLRPLSTINSTQSQNNNNNNNMGASTNNSMVNPSFQYSPRPGNWMTAPANYAFGPANKVTVDAAGEASVPILSAVEERRAAPSGRHGGVNR